MSNFSETIYSIHTTTQKIFSISYENCSEIDSRFSAKVFPIIQSSCATNSGCHATGSSNGPGALTNFTQISQASSAIRTAVLSGIMPKGSSLSIQDKNAIA